MWQVLPGFARAASALVKRFGGGTKGIEKAAKHSPQMFKETGKRTTKKISNVKTLGKAQPSKIATKALTKGGFTEVQLGKYREMYRNRNKSKAWGNLSQSIKDKLLK